MAALRRIAVVILVDPRGHLLLQHRDEHAPRAPGQWGLVGGHAEPGESLDEALVRELREETGIATAVGPAGGDAVTLWHEGPFTAPDGLHSHYAVYAGGVDLTDDDIVLGEGRAIVFVDPERALALDLADSAAHFLPLFLASPTYRRLASGAA